MRNKLGIYIHIPFCVKKCNYCDFLSAPADDITKRNYVQALLLEINSYRGRTENYSVQTVFIGGGTPSCIDAHDIEDILRALRDVFYTDELTEISIEINPGTIHNEMLLIYKKAGINRLSFGLQSTNEKEIKLLGRIHSYKQFVSNYMQAREIGFQNINIDLISSLPGQSVKDWEATLERVIDLSPEHISAYSLIIEEGTPFYEKYGQDADFNKELPDEETDRLIYKRTKEVLEKHGYLRYEISNYAKPGYECKHNSSYWTRDEYLGLGLGAASLIKETRFHNTSDLTKYLKECLAYQENSNNWSCNNKQVERVDTLLEDFIGIREEIEKLNLKQQIEEFMFLGLRMCQGIRLQTFEHKFHQNIDDIYDNEIKKLEGQKLIVKGQDNISLTEHGLDVSNYVFLQFMKD